MDWSIIPAGVGQAVTSMQHGVKLHMTPRDDITVVISACDENNEIISMPPDVQVRTHTPYFCNGTTEKMVVDAKLVAGVYVLDARLHHELWRKGVMSGRISPPTILPVFVWTRP